MAEGVVARSRPRRFGWYYGWTIVAVVMLSQMMSIGLVVSSFSLFLTDWHLTFQAPVSTFQLGMMVFAAACIPFCVASGWACDRFPIRWVTAVGLLIISAMELGVAFSHSAWIVVALYVLVGAGTAFSANIPAQAAVSRWFVKRRGLALGISALGAALSAVVFPPIVGLLMRAFGWRETWWLIGGFTALVFVPVMVLLMRDRPDPNDASGYLTGRSLEEVADAPLLTYGQILSRPNFWIVGLAFICAFAAYMGVITNLPPLVKSHGLDGQTAVLLLSAYGGADLLSKLLCGAATDRFGNRTPLVVLCLVASISALGLAFAPAPAVLIASLLGMGLAGGIWTLLASATVVEFGQQNFGRAFGLISALTPFGTLMPWILARTEERTGSYAPGLVGLAAVTLAAAGLALALREKKAIPGVSIHG